jgi:hypothetical protein
VSLPPPPPAARNNSRPTLTGGVGKQAPLADGSILQALENRGVAAARPSRSRKPRGFGFFALMALVTGVPLLGVAWWSLSSQPQPGAVMPATQTASAEPVAPVAPAAPARQVVAAPALKAPEAPASPAAPPATALLEQLPESKQPIAATAATPPATVAAVTAATAATAAAATMRPPSAAKASSVPTAVASAAPTSGAKRPAPVAKANAARPQQTALNSGVSALASTASQQPANARQAGLPAASTDPDVELMAALMSHVDGTREAAPKASKVNPVVLGQASAREQSTIAGLVKQCRLQPKAQADQCRREICAGYWGKAEACPGRKPARKARAERKTKR